MEEPKKNKLDNLKNRLYSRKAPNVIDHSHKEGAIDTLSSINTEVNESWTHSDTNSNFDNMAYKLSKVAQKKHSFIKRFFVGSLILFIITAIVALFVFWGGMNFVSSENVDIKVLSPVSVGAGQENSFDVTIINNNNTTLEGASLLIEYPLGTRVASDLSKDLNRERFAIGIIKSKESYTQKITPVFFGEKEDIKKIKISLEYRIENSSALFFKEKIHDIIISSSPVIITPIYPKEVNSNQDMSFKIEIASNSKETISNLLLKAEYPFGFVYKSSSQSPANLDNTWLLPSLKSGEKKTISINGTIIGQDNEERAFRFSLGTPSEKDDRQIGVLISQLTESILVKKPFIGLDIFFDGKTTNFFGRGGKSMEVEFVVRNNLPTKIFNVNSQILLESLAYNKNSVSVGNGGFFRSIDNTILWDNRSIQKFNELDPGEEVRLSFKFTPLEYLEIPKTSRPEINLNFNVTGERVLESGSVESVSAIENKKIVLGTDLKLSPRVVRSEGNLENYGPIPPKIDTPTSYTVIWAISNTFNQVNDVEVRATLPPYVRFTGQKNPDNNEFIFNAINNEIVWHAGTILPNTGFSSSEKKIYFQVEFIPSVNQINETPVLVPSATMVGKDRVTGASLGGSIPGVTINFSSDPTFKFGDERVGP